MAERAQILIGARDDTAAAWASVQRNASGAIANITSLLPGLAGALSAAGLVAFAKQAIDSADRLNDLSKSTGVSVESLSGLQLLARQTGTDLEGLARSINRMSVEIGKDPEKFRQLGITATDNVGRFRQFADIFNSLPDIAQRNALSNAVFGRSWADIAPALAEGSQKIGEIIDRGTKLAGVTSDAAAQADEFNDRMAELNTSLDAVKTTIAVSLLPQLNKVTAAMAEAQREGAGFWATMYRGAQMALTGDDLQKTDVELVKLTDSLFAAEKKLLAARAAGAVSDTARHTKEVAEIHERIRLVQGYRSLLDQPTPAALAPGKASPADVAKFLDGGAGAAKAAAEREKAERSAYQMTLMKIESTEQFNKAVAETIRITREMEDAEFAASVSRLEQIQGEENAAQASFNAMMERSLEDGRITAESLLSTEETESLSYQNRLANLEAYLASVQASSATAANLRQNLEARHQQTLLQIEANKHAAVRSMQHATWSAAGDLLQQFAGDSQIAAIAVIAISKGLAIAQAIQSTAVATMRAFADLGPIAGAAAAAKIKALGAVQIGLIAATGLAQAAQVGSGGASLGSPANPVSTAPGALDAPFTQATAAAPAPAQTTVVQFTGTTDERKLLKKFVDLLNENSRDGGRIITA